MSFKITGAEGVTPPPFCFTRFFTAYAKPNKSDFSLLHYPHLFAFLAFCCALVVTGTLRALSLAEKGKEDLWS